MSCTALVLQWGCYAGSPCGCLCRELYFSFHGAVQAFYADIYAEAKKAKPSSGHHALAAMAEMGRLQRHYTMNIDGLAECVGLTTWHPETNPSGAVIDPSNLKCIFSLT